MIRDMTQGNPMHLLIRYTIPLVLGNLCQQLYNLADTIIVGNILGLTALTSVAVTSSVNFLIVGFVIGVCNGLAIPVAQQFGAKEYSEMRKYIWNAVCLSIFLTLLLTSASVLFCDEILHGMKTPENVYAGAYEYFFIICLGIPLTVMYNLTSAIMRALGDSKTPLYFLVISAMLNIFLDIAFILKFQMNVSGAAWATVLSQGISGLACLFFMKKKLSILYLQKEEKHLKKSYLKVLLINGIPMGLQYSVTAVGSIMLQSAVNTLPAVFVSAFAAVTKIKQLVICVFDALGTACASYAGQNFGANNIKRIRKGVRNGIELGIGYALILGVFLMLSGWKLALLFVDSKETEVLQQVQVYFQYTAVFFWLLSILSCIRLTIQGIGYGKVAILAGIGELAARAIAAMIFTPNFGYKGVCIADPIAWLSAVIIVSAIYGRIIKNIKR